MLEVTYRAPDSPNVPICVRHVTKLEAIFEGPGTRGNVVGVVLYVGKRPTDHTFLTKVPLTSILSVEEEKR